MKWFVILAVITGGLILGLPPSSQSLSQMHVSSFEYRLALLVLLIPYGIIWYAAFYAYARLKEYSQAIKGFDDGNAFRSITIGMGLLAVDLVVPTAVAQVTKYIASIHPGFTPASVIISTYFSLALTVITFLFINNGTHMLTRLGKVRPALGGLRVFVLAFITLAVVFTHLVMTFGIKHDVYHLSAPLLIITFVIPALFAWYIALQSAYEFGMYTKNTEGLLYRNALRQFAYGIVVTIFGSVADQFLDNTVALKISHSIGSTVVVDYAVLIVYAVGLILMALGAKKLKRIEEV